MTQDDKIKGVLLWADTEEGFDDSFIQSLAGALEHYGQLTPRQEDAIDNIIDKWGIDVSFWLNN